MRCPSFRSKWHTPEQLSAAFAQAFIEADAKLSDEERTERHKRQQEAVKKVMEQNQ